VDYRKKRNLAFSIFALAPVNVALLQLGRSRYLGAQRRIYSTIWCLPKKQCTYLSGAVPWLVAARRRILGVWTSWLCLLAPAAHSWRIEQDCCFLCYPL